MGAGNVKAAYATWRSLSHASMRALAFMAVVSLDDDVPPMYFAGRETLAAALGRIVPPEDDDDPDVIKERRAVLRVVDRVLKDLADAGAIEVVKAAAPHRPARYALNLTGPRTTVSVDRSDHGERGPMPDRAQTNEPRSASSTNHGERHERTTVSVTTDHGERGPEEKEEEGGLSRGLGGWSSRQPQGSAHARESAEQTRQRQQSELLGVIDAQAAQAKPERPQYPTCECGTALEPDGSCFTCRTAS